MISFRVEIGGLNDSVLHYSVNVDGLWPADEGGEWLVLSWFGDDVHSS